MNKFKKISFNDVTLDPINHFYKYIENNLDDLIRDCFYSNEKCQNAINNETKLMQNIEKNLKDIKNKKKNLKINYLKIQNVFIIVSCFLIFGFFFLKTFNQNWKTIKTFKEYKSEKNNIINECWDQKIQNCKNYFLPISIDDLLTNIFNQMGIEYQNSISSSFANFVYDENKILKIKNCFEFKYKNSPIYDILYQKISFAPVVTSASVSYAYTTNDNTTSYEVLTAHHTEMTPFIRSYNSLYYLTNFDSKLNFSSNNKRHYLKFENKKFSHVYKINNNDNKMNSSILNFFTIKAQEDYLKWWELKNKKVNSFYKNKNFIALNTNDINKFLIYASENFNFSCLINSQNDIETIINIIINSVKSYIKKWLNQIILPLISPAINREWYTKNGHYLTGNYFENDEKNENDEIDINYEINKIQKFSVFTFITNNYKREPWLEIIYKTKINEWTEFSLNLKSYDSVILYDYVSVTGSHVGTQVIPVQYESFFEIYEEKNAYFLSTKNSKYNNYCFVLNKNFENGIWQNFEPTDNVNDFSYKLNNLIEKANELIEENLFLIKNEKGIWIIDNDPFKYKNDKIIQLKLIASQINNL